MTARFTVRSEADFIALAPVVLGFQPTHSLVMLTIDSFHARIDIPQTESQIEECIESLLMPALKHKVWRVAFVLFDEGDHDILKTALIASFMAADIRVLAALEVGEGRFRSFGGVWQPLDIATHPLTLEAQYQDAAPKYQSREEMSAYVKPCGETWTAEVQVAVDSLQSGGLDNCIMSLTRETAKEQTALWVSAVRGCDAGSRLLADIAMMAAFSAWLGGDGALAWVALDLTDDTTNWPLLLSTALEQAVDPARWSEVVKSHE